MAKILANTMIGISISIADTLGLMRASSGGAPPVYVPKLDFSDSRNSQYALMGLFF